MGILKKFMMGLLALSMASCDGLFDVSQVGKPIKFGTGKPSTRVFYPNIYEGLMQWGDKDSVKIYMYWEKDGVLNGPKTGDYIVQYYTNNGYQSYGRLVADGEPLKWQGDFSKGDGHAHEYPHTFVSSYPKNDLIDGKYYQFNLPSDQDVHPYTEYMYMTAYEEDITSESKENENEYVHLHYYPAVTTLVVTINNDANIDLGSWLTLKSASDIIGTYNVYPSDRSVSIVNGTNELAVEIKVGKPMMFFIIPQDYYPADLYFELYDGNVWPINHHLDASGKFIITIKTTEKEPEVEEPEPLPPLSVFVNGVIAAEAHKKFLNWQFGDTSKGEDPNKLYWTNQDNNNAWEPVPDDKLWEIIESVVDLDITSTWEAKEITAEDLNIFPNLRTVNIDATNLDSIEVNNPNITSLNVKSQTLKHVSVENCDGLTTFTMAGNYSIEDVTVKGNRNLLDFHILGHKNDFNFYLLAESNPKLETFEVQQLDEQGNILEDAWGLIYRFDINNCDSFKNYKVSNHAKPW